MENITEGKNPIKINSLQNYRNEYLFSEIYLRDIIQRPITDENLRASLKTIREWKEYADKTSLEKWTNTYIEPILDTLGFGHHREKEGISNILLLFPDFDKNKPMSICYVVPPGEDINCTIKGKHWAEKIIRNLRKHNFEWGILTDGIYWRIYNTKESTPYETYLEVNLELILNNQDYLAFQIFYFFFRPDNFIKNENGECKFDNYKEESVKTTEYIEENLRTAIEREEEGGGVLQTICLGYLDALRKGTYSEEERQRIYGGAILYLFRLLFLFYSTSRDLLKSESIEAFKSIVLDSFRFHNESGAQSNSYALWLCLQDIFAEIDLTYDGGLFNPHESNLTQFIEEVKITDPFISEVVFGLAYYQKSKGNFVPIEYRDLSVRHLGSLYEGLLEHNLFIAEEDTVIRKSGAKVIFIPQSQAGRIIRSETIIEKGKVYFSEDSKERKLTGSYYTPDDIVEYIVKNTVDALLAEKKKELISEIEPILNDLESAINESERKQLELFIDDKILKFIEEKILSLSVLDPAMGSGHFLVNVTNHIANFIVDLLNKFPGHNPKINYALAYWRRRAVEKCIYGVDLNPLAVELAKLCLWITTALKENPLSFLNHHLKQGNALVGVSISDIQEHFEKQSDLFMQSYIDTIKQAAHSYREELSRLTEAIEDIDQKKEILEGIDKKLSPHKQLCSLFIHHLSGKISEDKMLFYLGKWNQPDELQKVSTTFDSKNLFHWELEFPDVFYGDNLGFDTVIGNPPYIQLQKLKGNPIQQVYKNQNFKTYDSNGDIYGLFYEKGIKLLKQNGHLCFITSNKWMRAVYGEKLRLFFIKYNPIKLIDLGPSVFESVMVDTNILIIQKKQNQRKLQAVTCSRAELSLIDFVNKNAVILRNLTKDAWFIGGEAEQKLKEKIEQIGTPLKDWDINIYRGVLTGYNDAFIINTATKERLCSEDPKSTEIIKPILRGRDIKRYQADWAGLWLIATHNGYTDEKGNRVPPIDINKYKIVKDHLDQYYPQLVKRQDKGNNPYNLRSCAYQGEFEKEKVVYPETTQSANFYFDRNTLYIDKTAFMLLSKNINMKLLCTLLSSKLETYYYKYFLGGTVLGENGYQYNKHSLENLPIPKIPESEQAPFISLADKILETKKQNPNTDTSDLEKQIDKLVYKLFDLTEDEIKIVEESQKK